MSAPSQEAILDYFEDLASEMRLSDWEFFWNDEAEEDTDDGKALAKVDASYGRKLAWVATFDDLWDLGPSDQRHIFVHELIHLLRWRSWIQVVSQLEDHLAPAAYDMFVENYKMNMEYEVDDMAAVMAINLPLPPWSENDQKPPVLALRRLAAVE